MLLLQNYKIYYNYKYYKLRVTTGGETVIYGYARVSAKDQCEARQLIEFKRYGLEDEAIFMDKQSGKDFNRTNYKRLRRILKKNDLLIVKSIDRLGRNYSEILEEWRYITKVKNADIKIYIRCLSNRIKKSSIVQNAIDDFSMLYVMI